MSQQIDYYDNDIRLEGILLPNEKPASNPIVIVLPTYARRDAGRSCSTDEINSARNDSSNWRHEST